MSKFAEKLRDGLVPNSDEWQEYLIEFHRATPGMTPQAFGRYRTTDGQTSYAILADRLVGRNAATVVDLACGDGHLGSLILERTSPNGRLIGIDMSEGELALARNTFQSEPRARFVHSVADALPLADGSVDVILCHMAFMLMIPVEPIVAEVARVLKPGGEFSAVIGNRQGSRGLYSEILKTAFEFLVKRFPKMAEAPTGDRRMDNVEGLQELFNPLTGFVRRPVIREFWLQAKVRPQGIWEFMRDMYFVAMQSSADRILLEQAFDALGKAQADADGWVHFECPLKMITVTRRENSATSRSTASGA